MLLWFLVGNVFLLIVAIIFMGRRRYFSMLIKDLVITPTRLRRTVFLSIRVLIAINLSIWLFLHHSNSPLPIHPVQAGGQTGGGQSIVSTTTTTTTKNQFAKGSVGTSPLQINSNVSTTTVQDDYKKIFFNDANLTVVRYMGDLLLAVLASFIVTLPFLKVSELNILGNGIKLTEDKLQENVEISENALEKARKINLLHTKILYGLAVDNVIKIEECFDGNGKYNMYKALLKLADFIEAGYHVEKLDVTVGVLEVENNKVKDLDQISNHSIRETLSKAAKTKEMEKGNDEILDTRVIPFGDQLILYISSPDVKFSDPDIEMILTGWKIIDYNALVHVNIEVLQEKISQLEGTSTP